MDYLSIIQLAIQYGPQIKNLIDAATSNGDLSSKLSGLAPPVAKLLEDIGAQFFPKAAPTLHIVAGAIGAFDPNATKWLQGSINVIVTPSPNLLVDGIYGAKTRAAVEQLQTKLGLKVDGVAGQITRAAITAALATIK